MRTVRPYRVADYVVVGSGIKHDVDSQTLFRDISAWTKWRRQFADVELTALLAEKDVEADEVIIPAPHEAFGFRLLWRLEAKVRNFWRRRINRREAKRQAEYFSPEGVEKRRMASQ